VAVGIASMLENWQQGGCFILSGHEVTVRGMLAEIAKASGMKLPRVKLPFWFALGTSYFAEFYYFLLRRKPLFTHYSMKTLRSNCNFSNARAMKVLGFAPRPLRESMSDMTAWVAQHFVEKRGKRYKQCPYK
jgi:dihydroflavonol-4-reductase